MSLALAAVDGAAGWARAAQVPGASIPTLLTARTSDELAATGIPTTASPGARRVDDAVSPATFLSQTQPPPAARPPGDPGNPLPEAAALPASGQPAQAQAPDRSQPAGGAQQPARPNPATPQAPARNQPAVANTDPQSRYRTTSTSSALTD